MDYFTIATTALSFLKHAAPFITKSDTVKKGLDLIETLMPVASQYAQDMVPVIKDIINTFRGNKVSVQEHLDQMDKLDEQCDKILDDALAAAQKADDENKQG